MSFKIQTINTKKFKHIDLSFKFVKKYKKTSSLDDYAICQIIGEYSNMYNTKEKMSSIKDNLYGLNVYSYKELNGDITTINFTYHFLNPKFSCDINEFLYYIKETLFNPYIDENILNEIKTNYVSRVSRALDKPSTLANNNLYKIIGKNNHLKNRDIDQRTSINSISIDTIMNNYASLLKNSDLYIYIIGDIERFNLKDEINTWFNVNGQNLKYHGIKLHLNDYNTIIEDKTITQTYLRVVYESDYSNLDDNYYKWMVADSLLGTTQNSLLFKEVREKRSLCYVISSSLLKGEGLSVISSAINFKEYKEVLKVIDSCIDLLINQKYELKELDVTKKLLINSIKANNDDAKNTIDFIHGNNIFHHKHTIDDICHLIKNVTHDDISEVMKTYKRKLVYILRGTQDETN